MGVTSGMQEAAHGDGSCHGCGGGIPCGIGDFWDGVHGTGPQLQPFLATALAELVGCYLPLLWLTGKGTAWLKAPPAAGCTPPTGAVYIATALGWLYGGWGYAYPDDYVGAGLALAGA